MLVDEDGRVTQGRVQQGIAGQAAINDGRARRESEARSSGPATKNGIPVKMWRPVIVDVKP